MINVLFVNLGDNNKWAICRVTRNQNTWIWLPHLHHFTSMINNGIKCYSHVTVVTFQWLSIETRPFWQLCRAYYPVCWSINLCRFVHPHALWDARSTAPSETCAVWWETEHRRNPNPTVGCLQIASHASKEYVCISRNWTCSDLMGNFVSLSRLFSSSDRSIWCCVLFPTIVTNQIDKVLLLIPRCILQTDTGKGICLGYWVLATCFSVKDNIIFFTFSFFFIFP